MPRRHHSLPQLAPFEMEEQQPLLSPCWKAKLLTLSLRERPASYPLEKAHHVDSKCQRFSQQVTVKMAKRTQAKQLRQWSTTHQTMQPLQAQVQTIQQASLSIPSSKYRESSGSQTIPASTSLLCRVVFKISKTFVYKQLYKMHIQLKNMNFCLSIWSCVSVNRYQYHSSQTKYLLQQQLASRSLTFFSSNLSRVKSSDSNKEQKRWKLQWSYFNKVNQ